jgi:hypothetical protein
VECTGYEVCFGSFCLFRVSHHYLHQWLMIRALHRSPQDWTSYNQYLSDASKLFIDLCMLIDSGTMFSPSSGLADE